MKIMAFVATTDAARSRAFYQDVVGLRFIADEPYALVFDSDGIMVRVQKAKEVSPHPFTTLGWEVPDLAAAVEKLSSRGASFERYQWNGGQEIWTAPGGTQVAWFKDPDGNLLSLTQF